MTKNQFFHLKQMNKDYSQVLITFDDCTDQGQPNDRVSVFIKN